VYLTQAGSSWWEQNEKKKASERFGWFVNVAILYQIKYSLYTIIGISLGGY